MNPNGKSPTSPSSTDNEPKQDDRKGQEEQFWTEWWREYAQTWK